MSNPTADSVARSAVLSGTKAFLIALGILLPFGLLGFMNPRLSAGMVLLAIAATSAWAAVDSSRLQMREYKSQVSAHPWVLFTAMLGAWIVVFPCYLVVRSKLAEGLLPKQSDPKQNILFYASVLVWFLMVLVPLLGTLMVRFLPSAL